MNADPGSFRDPSGRVYEKDGRIYRTIAESYSAHWEKAEPFLTAMAEDGLVVPFEDAGTLPGAWKALQVEKLPLICYPYEWSHEQLKDAALLTLTLQKRALRAGLILKDATAYNIQFRDGKPIFIDHLSFEVWSEGAPWTAYRQFCSHFLSPLALMSTVDLRCGLLSRLWIDGIPLDMAAAMMPKKKRWNPSLNFHLFLHARMQDKYSDTEKYADEAKKATFSVDYLVKLADSLERLILHRDLQPSGATTQWGDYYENTNYSSKSADGKYSMVEQAAQRHGGKNLALDLGANTGRYTKAIAAHFDHVIAADVDPLAVNRHYTLLKDSGSPTNILPLVVDFSSPTPGIGFHNTERAGFGQRCKADFIIALAVIHHFRITAGIPLALIAEYLSSLLSEDGVLLLEFVPREDSQAQKLLALREDLFDDYTLDGCVNIFSRFFHCLSVTPIPESRRHILELKRKSPQRMRNIQTNSDFH